MSNPNPSPETRFKPGQSGNPGGRPKDSLKAYLREKFIAMTDEEKEEFLKTVKPEFRWRMAEGNPHKTIEAEQELRVLVVPAEVAESMNSEE